MRRGLVLVSILFCAAQRAEAQNQPGPNRPVQSEPVAINPNDINLGFPEVPRQRVLELVDKLGSASFAKRKAATEALEDLGPGAFATMAEAFRTSGDFETRVRIQEAVRRQYLWHALLKRNGFLGIRFNPTPQLANDPRFPEGALAYSVEGVVQGLPADLAGMRTRDLIVEVDGVALNDLPNGADFPKLIGDKGAGVELSLTILRRHQVLTVEATLIARPLNQYQRPTELADQLDQTLQQMSLWWSKYFAEPEEKTSRAPASTVFQIPD